MSFNVYEVLVYVKVPILMKGEVNDVINLTHMLL